MHDCDMLSELQTVGLAGSVSIAQPIIETTVVSAGDHARLLAEINRKFSCILDCAVNEHSSGHHRNNTNRSKTRLAVRLIYAGAHLCMDV